MDGYEASAVFSSIDSQGRYSYGNQPIAAQWNLARFAETLLPLLDPSSDAAVKLATDAIAGVRPRSSRRAGSRACAAKWVCSPPRRGDGALIRDLLDCMQEGGADFTLTFRRLSAAVEGGRRRPSCRHPPCGPVAGQPTVTLR